MAHMGQASDGVTALKTSLEELEVKISRLLTFE